MNTESSCYRQWAYPWEKNSNTVAYVEIKKKKSFQCNNQCSLHFNTLWTYVSALILKHGYLPTRFHQSVQNFCFSFTVEMVFWNLALRFSTTEDSLKSNAIKLAIDLVIHFALSEICLKLCHAPVRSLSGWHLQQVAASLPTLGGIVHGGFSNYLLPKYSSWVPLTLQTV